MNVVNVLRVPTLFWRALASINLTIVLCLLLAADVLWGYACIKWRTALFIPLNDLGIVPWIQTYGLGNLQHTSWFFLLLLLLAVLALNTASCTLERVRHLLAARASLPRLRLVAKLGPHIMHAAVLVILVGYLASYLYTEVVVGTVLLPGRSYTLPDNAGSITFTDFIHQPYQGTRLDVFQGEVIRPQAALVLRADGQTWEATLGYNRPVRLGGYSVHLDNFAPKKPGGMRLNKRIDLHIRKDPGVVLYLAGIAMFCLGIGAYMLDWRIFWEVRK